jgi:hypothetical protein
MKNAGFPSLLFLAALSTLLMPSLLGLADELGCPDGTCATRPGPIKRVFRRCPKCQCDVCILHCENEKVKKTCFDVDQQIVCLPKVKFPWQKCCPTCSKTRVVKVLGVKTYECQQCLYTWKVAEPEVPPSPEQAGGSADPTKPAEPEDGANQSETPDAEKPTFEPRKSFDPTGGDVPAPPPTRPPLESRGGKSPI